MKTRLFILLAALSFLAATLIAQEKTTLVIPEGGVLINGVVWATCNVAAPGTFAASPEDAGMFYQWNRKIGWSTTDPMVNSDDGTTWDNTLPAGTTWEKSNDPSPSGWRVPTTEEQRKLLDTDKVTSEWVIHNGVTGRKFTDNISGASIFLPAVGFRLDNDGTFYNVGSGGNYWSSMQYGNSYAYSMFFRSGGAYGDWSNRGNAFSVRPVVK